MKTEPKKNKTAFPEQLLAKKQSKTRAFEPKKTEQKGFFLLTASQAQQKSLKKISGFHWGSIKVVILIPNQIPRPAVRIFRLNY